MVVPAQSRHEALYAEAGRAQAAASLVALRIPRLQELGPEPPGLQVLAEKMHQEAVAGAARTTRDQDVQDSVARLACASLASASLPLWSPGTVSLSFSNPPRRHYLPDRLRKALLACLDASRTLVNSQLTSAQAAAEDQIVSVALTNADGHAHYAHMRAASTMPVHADRIEVLRHVATHMLPLVPEDVACIRRCADAYQSVCRADKEATRFLCVNLPKMMAEAASHAGGAEGMFYPKLRLYLEKSSHAPLNDTITKDVLRQVDEALALVPFNRASGVPRTLREIVAKECERMHLPYAYSRAAAYARRARYASTK